MKVFGKNVFNELRDNIGSIKKVYLAKNFTDKDIIKFIQDNKISYSVMDPKKMDGMVEGRHQGKIVVIDEYEYSDYHNMFNDGTVMKTSAGALEHVNIAMVNNLVNVIDDFKDNGFFVYAADMDGTNYKKVSYSDKVLLIIGSEGNGIGRLVKKNCDEILAIPQYGHVNSLNASVAAAILIYGIVNK